MRRRRRDSDDAQDSQESHERWLISYADFITLLFAFFVVMYAISTITESKYRKLAGALEDALGGQVDASMVNPAAVRQKEQPGQAPKSDSKTDAEQRKRQEKMDQVARELDKELGPLINQGRVHVNRNERGIMIDISDSVLFAQGQSDLSKSSVNLLKTLSSVIKDKTIRLEVGGHTDDVPIHTAEFPSNWELSAMRASTVVHLFRDNGVDDYRMIAVGYGSTRPVLPNDTSAARMRNRRVSILILPIDAPRTLLPEEMK